MPQAEITVQYLNINKKNPKYASIKSSEGNYYSCSPAQLKEFTIGEVCTIAYTVNEKGYNDFLKKVSSEVVPKQNVRPATNPADSDRMATMGMVNAVLNGMCERMEASSVLSLGPDTIAQIIGLCHEGLMRSIIKGKQAQRRDDMGEEIPFP